MVFSVPVLNDGPVWNSENPSHTFIVWNSEIIGFDFTEKSL